MVMRLTVLAYLAAIGNAAPETSKTYSHEDCMAGGDSTLEASMTMMDFERRLSMVKLAHIIDDYQVPWWMGGWKRGLTFRDNMTRSAIFERDGECVLMMSGIPNGYKTLFANPIKMFTREFSNRIMNVCGYDVYYPFAIQLLEHAAEPEFQQILNYLGSSSCKKVHMGGSSTGGAFSSVLTACINQGRLGELLAGPPKPQKRNLLATFLQKKKPEPARIVELPKNVPQIKVEGLWIFGSPSPTRVSIGDAKTPEDVIANNQGCLNGQRFVMGGCSQGREDFVPYLTNLANMRFPKLGLTEIIEGPESIFVRRYPCESEQAQTIPNGKLPEIFKIKKPTHHITEYVELLTTVEWPLFLDRLKRENGLNKLHKDWQDMVQKHINITG